MNNIYNFLVRLKNIIWPIYGAENKRVLGAGLMMALSLWNYSGSRGVKDALMNIVAGAQSLPLVKVFAVVPFSMLMLIFYNHVSRTNSFTKTFYIIHKFFIAFFAIFAFFLYPFRAYLHLTPSTIASIKKFSLPIEFLPHIVGFTISIILFSFLLLALFQIPGRRILIAIAIGVISLVYNLIYQSTEWLIKPFEFGVYNNFDLIVDIVGNWTYALYYVASELTGTFTLTIFSWQILNKISSTEESKRFYPSVGIIGNIFGGVIGSAISSKIINLGTTPQRLLDLKGMIKQKITLSPLEQEEYYKLSSESLNLIYYFILNLVIAVIQLYVYKWIDTNIIQNHVKKEETTTKKSKVKAGAGESFALLFSSKYLLFLTLIILSYNISMVPLENAWKHKLNVSFSDDSTGYAMFMQKVMQYNSIITVLMMIIGANILPLISWKTGALVTPVLSIIFLLPFFSLQLFEGFFYTIFDVNQVITITLLAGTLNNIMTKATKYAFFDPTKEVAYIPVDESIRTKGKGAADLIGGRIGKAIGSCYLIALTGLGMKYQNTTSLLNNMVFWIAIFGVIIYIMWFLSIFIFSKEYEKAKANHEENKS